MQPPLNRPTATTQVPSPGIVSPGIGDASGADAGHRVRDCIVCGSCTVDILVRGLDLDKPIGSDRLHRVDPIVASVGGIVSNSGITMARLGMRVAGFSATGNDPWSGVVGDLLSRGGVETSGMMVNDALPTSTTVVTIDESGRRSFLHSQGAPRAMTADDYLAALPMFAESRAVLVGYYPRFPRMLDRLAEVMRAIRGVGCLTAMDSAGGGGTMSPLREVLPHLDVYFPSLQEATAQTGRTEPAEILASYRDAGAAGIVGVKCGARGALISPRGGEQIRIAAIRPPAPVVDTTGAGDAFFAGFLTGILGDFDLETSGRLAAAAGSVSTTAVGATTAAVSMQRLKEIAGFTDP